MPQTAVVKQERRHISRPLKVLIPLIQADLERGSRAAKEYYADAGDKLIEAKEQVTHGYWGSWLSKNFHLSADTARLYMRYATLRAEQNGNGVPEMPSLRELKGATQRERKKRKGERAFRSALRDLETDLYKQEQQTHADEVQLHREMALELIDVGWKALATRLHPDRGGSRDAMVRLNRVRDELKGIAKNRRFV